MHVLVEDTARNNLASWTEPVVTAGTARGAVLSPFTQPRLKNNYKQSANDTAQRIQDFGGEVWFDAATHALQMPNVGDFRYYQGWDLWAGSYNDLGTNADQLDHIKRVFAIQDSLGGKRLAPTILLKTPQSADSQRALEMAEVAVAEEPDCYVTVAGDPAFWAGGTLLDGHIGGLAQLEPAGWFFVVTRSLAILPATTAREEIHGLCRSVRSLSEDGPIHISHGDLAALPAFVAGASSVGSGWDPRQRFCAYTDYAPREEGGEGGQWFTRSTLKGLLSILTRGDAEVLQAGDSALAARLLPGQVPPGSSEAWEHHARVLHEMATVLTPGGKASYEALRDAYASARADWSPVATIVGGPSQADAWLREVSFGLDLFAATEGW